MARRRIELPSAEELFGDKPPAPKEASPKGRKTAAPKPRKTAARATSGAPKRSTKKSSSSSKPSSAKSSPKARAAAKPRAAAARLSGVESRLSTMPVDALIDLRDGLEDLLSADTVDEAAVRRLLDSVGA